MPLKIRPKGLSQNLGSGNTSVKDGGGVVTELNSPFTRLHIWVPTNRIARKMEFWRGTGWKAKKTHNDGIFARHRTGGRRKPTRNYAASGLKLVDTPRSGGSANTLTTETHTNRCSSSSYLARSISTFFLAASFVQTRKHIEERASMYSLSPSSYARSRSLQIGQSIPAPLRRSAGPTVVSRQIFIWGRVAISARLNG